jgi:hypothetical protein
MRIKNIGAKTLHILSHTQSVPGGKVNILGRDSIGRSKQKIVYVHVSYSERFPRRLLHCTLYRRAACHVLTRVAKCIDVDGAILENVLY